MRMVPGPPTGTVDCCLSTRVRLFSPCGSSGRPRCCCPVSRLEEKMDVLHDRCAGLDIGKRDLKACVRTPSPTRRNSRRQEIRTFATTTNALLELRDWLVDQQVTLVVLEATGDYWRGAYYLLEDALNVMLVNAAHAKGLPGRKTDVSDSAWLAQLGECGCPDCQRPARRLGPGAECPSCGDPVTITDLTEQPMN